VVSKGSLDAPLDVPFYEGGSLGATDNLSMPVSVDGRPYLLDLALGYPNDHFHRASVQLLNTQQAQGNQDTANVPPEVWRRSIESWHQGAGQSRYDRSDSLPARCHLSNGVDPWQKFGFNLLHETTSLFSLTGGLQAILCSIDVALFTAVGTTVRYYATVLTAPTTHTSPATVLNLVTDGENLYTLCSNGVIEKRDSAGTWTTFYTVPSLVATGKTMFTYVKGHLLVGNGPTLLDVTNPALVQTVLTHPLASWWWRDATEGLSVIYVLGGTGDRWHIHRMSINSSATLLDPPIVAATLPDGEIAYTIATYLGYVLIGVHYGFRFGMPDSSGQVTYGQIVKTPGPVLCFEGQDRFVWFGLSILSGSGSETLYATVGGLGRMDLSAFVAPMTPAATSDLMGTAVGVTRNVVTVGGSLDGIGHRVFSVDNVGIFVEQDTLVASGWLSMGALNYNSTDKKMGLYVQVFHDPLAGGSVELDTQSDSDGASWQNLGVNSTSGTSSINNVPYPYPFFTVEPRVVLTRSAADHTVGPRVTRLEFRAIDIPGRSSEWHIPLAVFEDQVYDGVQSTYPVQDDLDFLIQLVESRRAFTYREAAQTWILHATDFTWAPNKLTSDGRSFQGTFVLIARELT
jgi:hypothetical protein